MVLDGVELDRDGPLEPLGILLPPLSVVLFLSVFTRNVHVDALLVADALDLAPSDVPDPRRQVLEVAHLSGRVKHPAVGIVLERHQKQDIVLTQLIPFNLDPVLHAARREAHLGQHPRREVPPDVGRPHVDHLRGLRDVDAHRGPSRKLNPTLVIQMRRHALDHPDQVLAHIVADLGQVQLEVPLQILGQGQKLDVDLRHSRDQLQHILPVLRDQRRVEDERLGWVDRHVLHGPLARRLHRHLLRKHVLQQLPTIHIKVLGRRQLELDTHQVLEVGVAQPAQILRHHGPRRHLLR